MFDANPKSEQTSSQATAPASGASTQVCNPDGMVNTESLPVNAPIGGGNGASPSPELLAALSHWAETGGHPKPPRPADPGEPSEARDGMLPSTTGAEDQDPVAQEIAGRGINGPGSALPHLELIQRLFGHYDVGGISAHIGGGAAEAADALGATAYASGNAVAFRSTPDLHTVAHEAAHVIQQRAGVHLKGGLGQAGDAYERHADAVADRVVRGESAEDLLDQHVGTRAESHGVRAGAQPATAASVQLLGDGLNGKPTRTVEVDQYIKMWEKKHHRKMTPEEKKTLDRGCIGITALNLGRGNINPPLENSFATFEQAQAFAKQWKADLKKQDPGWFKDKKIVIFSKRFYSGGKDYKPDPKTGRVDMSDYNYKAKPGFVNFDYGFYDEENHTWWHANHSQPGMKVYQSTLKHYSRPLLDFDKQIFCVTWAKKDI